MLGTATAWAQSADSDEEAGVEEVVVTGSYIKRSSFNSPSPVSTTTRSDIDDLGMPTVTDIVKNMTINTGSEFNPDLFTQVLSPGTSNINLRGLGLSSTLVLVNGRRQTVSAVTANDGSTFVDINSLMPLIAVDRIETLKDGAAALYGSDAVAGVTNFITRKNFEGLELGVDYQTVTEGSHEDITLSGIMGVQGDRGNIMIAASYLDRTRLDFSDREFTFGTGISGLGQPGAFIPLGVPTNEPFTSLFFLAPPGTPFKDPGCGTVGGINANPAVPFGVCQLDFSPFFALVPQEQRIKAYGEGSYEITPDIELFAEFGFSRNRTVTSQTPSTPNLTFPVVPANNPGNFLGVPAVMLGRTTGASVAGVQLPDNFNEVFNRHSTYRTMMGLRGALPGAPNWSWEAAFGWSANDFLVRFGDNLKSELNLALAGLGGTNCNPLTGTPGVGSCLFFNPFASGQGTNSQEVIDFVTGFAQADGRTTLTTVDAVTTGDLGDTLTLPGGSIGVAIGGQFRDEKLNFDWDENYNQENFTFLVGGPDFGGSREIGAAFLELALPVMDDLEVQVAVRHENYGSGVSSTDPKVAVLWQPTSMFSFRGSFGTSFRAPSLFQTFGAQTVVEEINDPVTGTVVFRPVRTVGSDQLTPESADMFNIGATVLPLDGLELGVDFWSFDFTDVITQENAQGLVNADPLGAQIIRDATSQQIRRVVVNFINAASVETNGFDFKGAYSFDTDKAGFIRVGVDATYVNKFSLQQVPGGPVINGAGRRNFTNFARSTPEWRANAIVAWVLGNHSANAILHHISSYHDDQADARISSHTTVDLQYNFQMPSLLGLEEGPSLSVGATNVFNNLPPRVATNGGFDSKVHDPRGRLVYFKLRQAL
ncbi:MAG: TonB-dependent receptor plug domain-containing protein [Sphingomonadales bacterium]